MEKNVVLTQLGRIVDFKLSRNCIQTFYIDTIERLDQFCDEVLTELEMGPTLIILETKGDSEMWKKKQHQVDCEKEFPNREPVGINVIS